MTMRTIAMVLYRDGQCYQSYGWRFMRPLGDIQTVVSLLDEHEIDEIALIRPVREAEHREAYLSDIDRLSTLRTFTPLSFGGGVRHAQDLFAFDRLPIERVVLSSAFVDGDEELLETTRSRLGRQAIQALLPVSRKGGHLKVFNCRSGVSVAPDSRLQKCLDAYANEVILFDVDNEGHSGAFDFTITECFKVDYDRLILGGGLDQAGVARAARGGFAAVMIENRILHQEYSPRRYRHV